jgi:hypothetical protein
MEPLDAQLDAIRAELGGRDVEAPVPHHVGCRLPDGSVVYADYRVPFIVLAMRRIHIANHRSPPRKPDPADVALIERWARQCPDQVCQPPFTACTHEP